MKNNKTIGIYKLTSPSGKSYIGQSKNIERRFYEYRKLHCKTQTKLYHALRKYGWDSFKKEIIIKFDNSIKNIQLYLNTFEIYFINKFNTVNNGYNLMGGGGVNSHSEETKLKISKKAKGKVTSEATKLKLHTALLGRKISDKNKEVVSKLKSKKILQFDKDMNFIKEWKSTREASLSLGLDKKSTAITNNLKGISKTSNGFIWKFK